MAEELDQQPSNEDVKQEDNVDSPQEKDETVDLAALKKGAEQETNQEEDSPSEPKPTFEKRFTQFKGDTPEEYLKQLEDAYANSTTEAGKILAENKRIREEAEAKAAQLVNIGDEYDSQPVAQQTATQVEDPALLHVRNQLDEQYAKEYTEFVHNQPELESDQTLRAKVLETVELLSTSALKKGKVLSMGEALKSAYVVLGYELNSSDTKEKVSAASKESASNSINSGVQKPVEKEELTDSQIKVANRMGLSKDQLKEHLKT